MPSAARKWNNVPLRRDDRFDTYFHTLSHDLRTPLNHISGFAELLHLSDGLGEAHREYAMAIMSACVELNSSVLAHLQLIEGSLRGEERAGEGDGTDVPDDLPEEP
jgi:signal transduction histidine kinase